MKAIEVAKMLLLTGTLVCAFSLSTDDVAFASTLPENNQTVVEEQQNEDSMTKEIVNDASERGTGTNASAGSVKVMMDHLNESVNNTEESKDDLLINSSLPCAGASDIIASTNAALVNEVTEAQVSYDEMYTDTENEVVAVTAIDPTVMYVTAGKLNVRTEPDQEAEKLDTLSVNTEVLVTGIAEEVDDNFVQVELENNGEKLNGFVSSEYLSEEKVLTPEEKYPITAPTEHLDTVKGAINRDSYGFRISYYHLDMSRCISIMRSKGYNEDVWVDKYGYLRMGSYIMAAGHYDKGTVLNCSQGQVIIVDHGEFEYTYGKNALDLCTVW